MIVRIVDYLASPGGGARFLSEMVQALNAHPNLRLEVVSDGDALERYRGFLPGIPADRFYAIRPANHFRTRVIMRGIPGAGPLNWLLGTSQYHYEVPESVFDGCDLVWLPWLSRHRIPWHRASKVVGTLHDVIILEFDTSAPAKLTREEHDTVKRWLASAARIVVDANATVGALNRLFGTGPDRVRVIPLSAQHRRPPSTNRKEWPFSGRPYLLCPANLSPHKNLDVLLAGVGKWGADIPLVLTGWGTDVWARPGGRAAQLRRIAERSGLERNRTIFGLDYVDDASYYQLLANAWALVIPTLAEGAGLPVLEALQEGIPVVSSDIPIAREMIGLSGGQALWFDPKNPADLAARLAELESDYPRHKELAVSQVRLLNRRDWRDVAAEYLAFMFPGRFGKQAELASTSS
jgi:glycosyltransferase involved in cell wall biosynthesis